ncbi:MAG TPA: 16S rRNA (adenine(1518)-N(6)/adenine(1519)-N(6))-dimethyltransferase RsmA [Candidatus Paceibacterota bacterium]
MGQHFLHSGRALETIIETARLAAGESVLEIGPGRGALTEKLLAAGARVRAVEKDDDLIGWLQSKFSAAIKNKQLELIHADILKIKNLKLKTKNWKLIANPPYYLTGQILRRFLTADQPPQLAVLMLQKEVVKRIIAADHKESILSISVKAYGEPRYIMTVPAKDFTPAPKVDSAIVLIDQINKNKFRDQSEEKFFVRLKRGFAGKRKMLKNNLELTAKILDACQIAPAARAENLNLNQWLCLAKYF